MALIWQRIKRDLETKSADYRDGYNNALADALDLVRDKVECDDCDTKEMLEVAFEERLREVPK